jgi:hypothetical protein
MFNDRRLELFLDQGQEFFSNACAHFFGIAVREVFPPILFASAQKFAKLVTPNAEQRPEDGSHHWMDAAKPGDSGPAHQVRKHSLRLIVRSMSDSDARNLAGLHQ